MYYQPKYVFYLCAVLTTASTFEKLSHAELLVTVVKLHHELDQLKRLVFGSKHERFTPSASPEQLALGLAVEPISQPEVTVQKVEYTRTITKTHKPVPTGRMKLPADLPRERIVIEPAEDVTGLKSIGEEITEELDYTPGKFFVRQYARPKYVKPLQKDGLAETEIIIASLPARPIDKCIAGAALLAHIVVNKYIDHLPVYRQVQRFTREGMKLPASTISGWISQVCALLEVLYAVHCKLVFDDSDYIQGDETPLKVLDKNKKGTTHQGYLWVYRAPVENLVVFEYQPGRNGEGPKKCLKNFSGHLQTDGYDVYNYFDGKAITLMHCMAHARRYFDKALDNDKQRAEHALTEIQKLYAIERRAKEGSYTQQQRYNLRQQEAAPILEALGQWMINEYPSVLPKSAIGVAINYSLQRWKKLSLYITDGKLEIDNNLVENAIRPVAIGYA